jgi:signal transduction histidine kinase/CheY-like chemotaxis protein
MLIYKIEKSNVINFKNNIIKKFSSLTNPYPNIKDEELKQKVKFLNSINLTFVIGLFLLFLTRFSFLIFDYKPEKLFEVFLPLLLSFFSLIAFRIGKSKYYKATLHLLMMIPLFGIWLDLPVYLSNPDANQTLINSTLVLGIVIVLSGLIYSDNKIFIILILSCIDLYLFYAVQLQYPINWVMPKLFFLIIVTVLTVLGLRFRSKTFNKLLTKTQELKKEKEKAELADKAKSIFLANISHEIRTPLNLINGYTEILSDTNLNEEQVKCVNAVSSANANLLRIVNDILDLNMIEKQKYSIKQTSFNIYQFLTNMNQFKIWALKKDLNFEFVIDQNIPTMLLGDYNRIEQILHNIVDNAVKFTPKGSIEIKIELINETNNHSVILFKVIDTGIGIPKEIQPRVYDAFVQGKSELSQNTGGVGLGLSISKRLVDLMDGKIWFDSKIDVGTTFFVLLTFEKNYIIVKTDMSPTDESILSNNLCNSKRILLVDDLPDNLELIKLYLKALTLDLTLAYDGAQAVELIKSNNFDLIIMDIRMPVMDGNTAIKLIREWEIKNNKSPTPIVAVTAYAMKEEKQKSLKAGFTDYLSKPVKKEDLLKVVKQLITDSVLL